MVCLVCYGCWGLALAKTPLLDPTSSNLGPIGFLNKGNILDFKMINAFQAFPGRPDWIKKEHENEKLFLGGVTKKALVSWEIGSSHFMSARSHLARVNHQALGLVAPSLKP